ncbi:MAG: class I SAM-dependent methyltransferase [Candidatus Omnitrophota bacterium]|nr:MAG: class I SAM-dependent methyltransferase [Candidatus Omnitrophota bacterium]
MVPKDQIPIGTKESSELDYQVYAHAEKYKKSLTNEKVHGRITELLKKHKISTTADTKILEIGSGPFESLHDVTAAIKIAVDPLASEYMERLPIERKESNIVEAMAEVLPFKTDYFDIVVSRNSFDHLNNPEQALLEFHRVLKKDGTCIIECYVDSDPFVTHEPFVLTEAFIDKYIAQYFDFLKRKRILKPEGFLFDWMELVMQPKPIPLSHRPYDVTMFKSVADSYLELFSKGCEMIKKRRYLEASLYLVQSLAKNKAHFWTALYLIHSYSKSGKRKEASELIEKIECNIKNDFYPYISKPDKELRMIIKKALRNEYWDRLLDTFPKVSHRIKSLCNRCVKMQRR